MKKWQKIALMSAIAIATLANGGLLAFALNRHYKPQKPANSLAEVVKKTANITNAKKKVVGDAQAGKLIGAGEYKYESLAQSKIKDGASAELTLATDESSGGHFVLALLGDNTKIPQEKINDGWTIQSIAEDRMWAPGACSSKPTFLIGGKYIFIDDGKTNPDDKYSSYILFNMATAQYNYFGGDNFTDAQGQKEQILRTVNENDKLVFYIDPSDETGPLAGNTEAKHYSGNDHAYIIRRVIDPATLNYTDYSLPFQVPAGTSSYTIGNGYSDKDSLINLTPDGGNAYVGKVVNNRIEFSELPPDANSAYTAPPLESPLELKLNGQLSKTLPSLSTQDMSVNPNNYTTKFSLTDQGATNDLQFLIAAQRFSSYSTPVVYNQKTGEVNALTDSQILQSYDNYVPLGVF